MLRIRGPDAAGRIGDLAIRQLLDLRMSQLADGEPYDPERHGEMFVAEEGDTAEALEAAAGVFILTNPFDGLRHGHPDFVPVWEFVEEHSACFEIGFQMSDESAVAIFVPKDPGIDTELLAICAEFAEPAFDPATR